MAASITESWVRIETWLAAHAPLTYAALAPPADRSSIAAAEQALGLSFPDPLVESLLRHDGSGFHDLLPPFWWLLSTEEIIDCWTTKAAVDAKYSNGIHPDEPEDLEDPEDPEDPEDAAGPAGTGRTAEHGWQDGPGPDYGPWWHPRWIPFASDGCGDDLVIDLRRAVRRPGRVGEADHEQGGVFARHPMWASLPVLFEATATALETGGFLDTYRRQVSEGKLSWEMH